MQHFVRLAVGWQKPSLPPDAPHHLSRRIVLEDDDLDDPRRFGRVEDLVQSVVPVVRDVQAALAERAQEARLVRVECFLVDGADLELGLPRELLLGVQRSPQAVVAHEMGDFQGPEYFVHHRRHPLEVELDFVRYIAGRTDGVVLLEVDDHDHEGDENGNDVSTFPPHWSVSW